MPIGEFELIIAEEIGAALAQTEERQIAAVADAILEAQRVFTGGAGRSLLMMKAFAMRLMHLGLSSHVVGETTTPAIEAGDLLIVGTGSGRTKMTLAIIEAAGVRGARTAAITAHPDSPIARAADLVVEIHAPITGREPARPSKQPPGSLFEQCLLVLCDALILRLMRPLGTDEHDMRARHTKLE